MADSSLPKSVDATKLRPIDPFDWKAHARGCWAYSTHDVGHCDCTLRNYRYFTDGTRRPR